MLGISDAAESIGMHTQGLRLTLDQLTDNMPLPCILHWNQNHFVVLYKVRKKRGLRVRPAMTDTPKGLREILNQVQDAMTGDRINSQFSILNSQFFIADPTGRKYVMTCEEFCRCWYSSKKNGF